MEDLDDDELKDLYSWVDEIPLSRPKRNMTRDFSDGVLVAEMIKHYFPRLVELHNYVPANATKQKEENWHLLNRKVLRKLHIELSEDVIRSIALSRPMVIEKVLTHLREKIKKKTESSGYVSDRPEVDQSSPKGYNHHHQQESYPSHQKAGGGGKQARSSHQLPPAPPPVAPPQPHPLTPQTSTRETYFTRYTYTPGSPSDINSLCQHGGRGHHQRMKLPPASHRGGTRSPSNHFKKQRNMVDFHSNYHRDYDYDTDYTSGTTTTDSDIYYSQHLNYNPTHIISHRAQSPVIVEPHTIYHQNCWSDDLLDFDPQFDYQDSKLAAASDGGKQYSSDAVPRIDYEEKVQECLAKDEAVQILQAKIRRLEHLLHLKDTRIENLQTKLEQLRPSGNRR
ncbi:uncharacterized protein LOC141900845 isoform X1 [Tubulanus polymorphus]|uniref:uncharacterized protein LOC141900845 isoform X1 n=1 Tax=Tubulanus polymorphus TaxID=672921 RepID=UPI003DA439FB